MSALRDIIDSLERGEFVNHHGRAVTSLGDNNTADKVKNILEHHNREALRRRHEVVRKLRQLEGEA